MVKRIIKSLINRWRWHHACRFGHGVDVSLSSTFEGMSQLHPHVQFHGHLGYGSYIGNNSCLSARIGRFTSIAPYVRCNNGAHPYREPYATTSPCFFSLNPNHSQNGSTFANEQLFDEVIFYDSDKKTAVSIGNDCWIGEGAFLVGGINIADGAVVLAHAVVTKDVPPYAIVGGVPAKIVGYRYDNETIQFLLKTQWWNNSSDWFKQHWRLLCDINQLKRFYQHNA